MQHFFPTDFLHLNDSFLASLKKGLVGMWNVNKKNNNVKSHWNNFPKNKSYNKSSYIMSKISRGKYKKPSANSKLHKKLRKEYVQETISLLFLPGNSEGLSHMPREVRQKLMFVFLQLCVLQYIKKNLKLYVKEM